MLEHSSTMHICINIPGNKLSVMLVTKWRHDVKIIEHHVVPDQGIFEVNSYLSGILYPERPTESVSVYGHDLTSSSGTVLLTSSLCWFGN